MEARGIRSPGGSLLTNYCDHLPWTLETAFWSSGKHQVLLTTEIYLHFQNRLLSRD